MKLIDSKQPEKYISERPVGELLALIPKRILELVIEFFGLRVLIGLGSATVLLILGFIDGWIWFACWTVALGIRGASEILEKVKKP